MFTTKNYYRLILTVLFLWISAGGNAQICTGPLSTSIPGSSSGIPLSVNGTTIQHVSCAGSADGVVDIVTNGGSPGYTYSWYDDPSATGGIRNGLSGGTYTALVTDANGCFSTASTVVNEPQPLILNASSPGVSCSGGVTDITASASGGSPNYQYQLDSGPFQSSPVFSGVSSGNYVVTVKDTNNCTQTFAVTVPVNDVTPPSISAMPSNITITAWAGICSTPVNWAAPLSSDNCGTPSLLASHIPGSFFPLGTTTVTYTAQDGAGNTASASFTVTVNPTTLSVLGTNNTTVHANRECTDMNGWTHYFDTVNNIIVLSVMKNGVNTLGMVGDPTFDVRTATTNLFGTNVATDINNPPALYVQSPTWFVMNRFWRLDPVNQLSGTSMKVRFYFQPQDVNDLIGSLGPLSPGQIRFYKINGAIYDPNPANGHLGIPTAPNRSGDGYVEYFNNPSATTATGYEWVLGNYGGNYYAEYEVDKFSGGGGGSSLGGGSAFPVEFLSFTGRRLGGIHVLEWTTDKELGTDYFEVQRVLDGSIYESIGSVDAKGSPNATHDYTFNDEFPAIGNNTYRLKAVDTDGSFHYSNTVTLRYDPDTYFSVYPNPFQDVLEVSVDGITSGYTIFELYNAKGALVKEEKWEITTHTLKKVETSNLSEGVYFYKIHNAGKELNGKLIKP
ncbi:MAG: HYR domain-containing protein [Bacteroidia bacterium]|nr:HYR domain-containing protein [Bacteroidia bacterium]